MSVVTRQLREVVREHPVREKLLVTDVWEPAQTAVTLRDRLALDGVPSAGLLDRSVGDLAREAAEAVLAADGRRALPSIVRVFLVRRLARDVLLDADGGYFSDLPSSEGTYRSVGATLRELRLAGVTAASLEPGRFVSGAKGRAIRRLLDGYERRLESGGWVDDAGVLRAGLRGLRDGRVAPVAALMVLGSLRLRPLEARFLEACPAEEKLLLGWPGDRGVDPGPDRARRRLTGFDPAPAAATTAAPAPGGGAGSGIGAASSGEGTPSGGERAADGGGDRLPHRAGFLFRAGSVPAGAAGEVETAVALGAENEVRSVFREALADGASLDRVEVAYTDGDRYRPLLLSDAGLFGVRCTFGEGLPVELTRAGQALRLLYEWILEGFDDRVLRRMLRSGVLDFRESGLGLELLPSQAAGLVREARVGRGRGRYRTALRRLRGRVEDRIGHRRSEGRPVETLERRRRRIGELARLLDPDGGLLWEFVPPPGRKAVSVSEVAGRSRDFLERLVARHGRLEPPAVESLSARLEEVEREVVQRMPPRAAVRTLRDEIASHPVSRSGPLPGCLHVSPLEAAGYAGRDRLVVVGLDEGAFPGQGLEDPVLLDRERKALSAEIALKRRAPAERLYDLARALGEAEGGVRVLSSVRDVASDRELYPGSAFLRAHRIARRDAGAGFEACLDDLAPPVSFTAGGRRAASAAEAWLARRDRASRAYRDGVRRRYPGVARGRAAERRRASDAFTVYDGRVEAAEGALDPRRTGEVVSPSRLETLVESPFRYFLRYVLGLEPADELERDRRRWLDPLERGRLLHRLFRDVMMELTAAGERPDAQRHRGLVRSVADRALEAARERIPPPTEAAYRRQAREIRRTAEIFLRDEADRADEAEPWAFELRFGHGGEDAGGPGGGPASPVPVELELGAAGTLRLRGSIDRVDRLGAGRFRVWDYKTGSTSRHHRVDALAGGHLQWLLYALALERLLEREGEPGEVVRSGYLFPGDRAHGDRMDYPVDAEAAERLASVLARHLDLVAAGLFPHAADEDACRWCDFRAVCRRPSLRAGQAARKADRAAGGGRPDGPSPGPEAGLLARWRDG